MNYDVIREAQGTDEKTAKLLYLMAKKSLHGYTAPLTENERKATKYYDLVDGLLVYTHPKSIITRVVIPSSIRVLILRLLHGSPGCHRGFKPTLQIATQRFYWPGLTDDLRRWIRAYSFCRRRITSRPLHAGLTKNMIINKPWSWLCVDFLLKNLPKSGDGYRHALVVMCAFTRFPIVLCLKRSPLKN